MKTATEENPVCPRCMTWLEKIGSDESGMFELWVCPKCGYRDMGLTGPIDLGLGVKE